MHFKKFFLSFLLPLSVLQAQSNVGININDRDLEVLANMNLNTFAEYSDSTAYILDSYYLNSDGDDLFSIGISGENTFQGIQGLRLGFGTRLVFVDDFAALPLFGKASFILPFNDSIPTTSLVTSFAFAPTVLTFRDGEGYSEFRLEVGMEVIQSIHLFVGYRNINTEYKTFDKTFNESFYAGMKLSF